MIAESLFQFSGLALVLAPIFGIPLFIVFKLIPGITNEN